MNIQPYTTNLPGVPILPGRNTLLIQSGSPKNAKPPEGGTPNSPRPSTPDPDSPQKQTKETK